MYKHNLNGLVNPKQWGKVTKALFAFNI